MKATSVDKPFDDEDWLFELKLDGYRIEAVVDKGKRQALDAQQAGRRALLPRSRVRRADMDQRGDRHRRR